MPDPMTAAADAGAVRAAWERLGKFLEYATWARMEPDADGVYRTMYQVDAQADLALVQAAAAADDIAAAIPPTFYAGADTLFRVVQLVRTWQGAIRANQELEAKAADAGAREKRAGETTITYRGSGSDLATDVLPLLNEFERKRFLENFGAEADAGARARVEAIEAARDALDGCISSMSGFVWEEEHGQIVIDQSLSQFTEDFNAANDAYDKLRALLVPKGRRDPTKEEA